MVAPAAPSDAPSLNAGHPTSFPFVLLGSACVVGGGLLSAAMAPAATYHSSWAVAYIVLIAGVAQAALGVGQTALADSLPTHGVLVAELLCWNLGNAAVVVGTLLDVDAILYVGCLLLIYTLVLVLRTIRGAAPSRLLTVIRVIVVILLVSIPVGIVMQTLTH